MKKFVVAITLLTAGFSAAPTPALAGMCEAIHAEAISACGGESACSDKADLEYYACLKRMVKVEQ